MKPFSLRAGAHSFLAPYLVAEIGVNHEGDLGRAERMIRRAAEAGAHAAKFQAYKADLLASKEFSPGYWDTDEEPARSQHELFKRYDNFTKRDYARLAECCAEAGIDFLCTPFDFGAVAMLAPLVPAFKVASADLTNRPLLRAIAAHEKPVLLSTGAATEPEIADALSILEAGGVPEIALLHCVLNYPTATDRAQLRQIERLRAVFGGRCLVGYSDHVPPDPRGGMPSLEAAAFLGAVVIEKHFTDDKSLRGNDHYHAMDGDDLAAFSAKLAEYRLLAGDGEKVLEWEADARRNARRRIVATRSIAPGEIINEKLVTPLRADHGIEVARWDEILGRPAVRPIGSGTPLEWEDLV